MADDPAEKQRLQGYDSRVSSLQDQQRIAPDGPQQNRRGQDLEQFKGERDPSQQRSAAPDAQGREWHGPFQHQLNKGGLENILQEQQLIATEARTNWGGASAVRAHSGGYQRDENRARVYNDSTTIEFYSQTKPDDVHPRNGQATWRMEEGKRLDIHVSKVHQIREGQVTTTDYGDPPSLGKSRDTGGESKGAAAEPEPRVKGRSR